jgi:hypothetical protein
MFGRIHDWPHLHFELAFGSEGTTENSPAFQCRDTPGKHPVPQGRMKFLPPRRGFVFFYDLSHS